MNFLGHLYFSNNNPQLMMANLYGDFVKGKDYSYLPEIIQCGVLLHRQIDDFIDNHEAIKDLRLKLYHDLPKIAGIAIDLYMDHCLAKNWNKYHNENLSDFLATFLNYALTAKNHVFIRPDFHYPNEFIELLTLIKQQEWIENYKHIEGLGFACSGLSRRISFPNNLHEAPTVYKKNEKLINNTFLVFINDAIKKFNHL